MASSSISISRDLAAGAAGAVSESDRGESARGDDGSSWPSSSEDASIDWSCARGVGGEGCERQKRRAKATRGGNGRQHVSYMCRSSGSLLSHLNTRQCDHLETNEKRLVTGAHEATIQGGGGGLGKG
jgi:hypothetical protein